MSVTIHRSVGSSGLDSRNSSSDSSRSLRPLSADERPRPWDSVVLMPSASSEEALLDEASVLRAELKS